jgi:hypothetical protein
MNSEAEIIIAFLYKRSGKAQLLASELYLPLSLELGWFTSKQAQVFVKQAIKNHLLKKQGDQLTPTFDIATVSIPLGFQPTTQTISKEKTTPQQEKKPALNTLISRITNQTNYDDKTLRKTIQTIQQEKHILPEVAALLIAHEHAVNIDDLYISIEKNIFTEGNEE